MSDDIRERVFRIVAELVGHQSKWDDDVRLYHDLGISGDDADELLQKVHARFHTSFEGLDFSTYFTEETDEPWHYWLTRLFGYRPRKHIKLGHLVKVVEAGHWFDPSD